MSATPAAGQPGQPGHPGRRAERARRGRSAPEASPDVPGTRTGRSGRLQRAIDATVPAVAILLALLPLWPVYRSGHAVVAAVVGVALGTGIALLGSRRRWNAIVVTAVTVGALVATAALTAPTTAIGGLLPTIETWRTLGVAVVRVWKQVVTLQPPLGNADGLLAVVYLLALLGSVVAVTIALRGGRWRPLALIVPALVLAGSVLLGTSSPVLPVLIALAAVIGGLGWPAWRSGRLELNRPLGIAALAGAAVIGVVAGGVLAPTPTTRFVIRDHVEPPPLEEEYPSPLAGHRGYLKDNELVPDDVLLTLEGVPDGVDRVRVATLDSYTGLVWDVSNGASPAGGRFLRASDRFVDQLDPAAVEVEVTVGTYDDVWLPMLGQVEDVTFEAERGSELARSVFYNDQTSTAIVTARLAQGDQLRLTTVPEPTVTGAELGGQVMSEIALPPVQRVPDGLAALAARLTEGATTDAARVQALADGLAQSGYFSHGLEGDVPSAAGHGLSRLGLMVAEPEEMIGDAEQYAALMALMARELGWPARVVYGFERTQDEAGAAWEISGDEISAWVEVSFEGVGWVTYDPTPDENNVPMAEDPTPADRPQPQMLQPPPPPAAPPDIPSLDAGDADVDPRPEPEPEPEIPTVVRWLGYLGIPLALLLLPAVIALALKARRRRRRRARGDGAARVAGGWLELQDTAHDLGLERRTTATRREQAAAIQESFGTITTLLATRADAAVFGPVPADESEAAAFWAEVTGSEKELRRSAPALRRLRARISYASLRRRS